MRIRFLYFSIFLIWSCDSMNKNGSNIEPENEIKFKKIGEKIFPLDSLTSKMGNYFQYFENDTSKYFVLMNKFNNDLIFYDYETGNSQFYINMEKNGPNGVGDVSGLLVHSLDSIFIYSYNNGLLHIIDSSGKIKNKYNLISDGHRYQVRPYISNTTPMVKIGNKLLLNSFGSRLKYSKSSDSNEKLILELDLYDRSVNYFFEYPKMYSTGIWGTALHFMYNSYNPIEKKFIVSFPIDNNIYLIGKNRKSEKYLAKSSFIDKVKPLSTANKIDPPPTVEESYFLRSQPTYSSIHFDEFSQMYYRVAYNSMNEEDFYSGDLIKSRFRDASIIVLNSKLKKIGEVNLGKYVYHPNYQFYNKNGIHIMKLAIEDEDNLVFDIFKLSKDE